MEESGTPVSVLSALEPSASVNSRARWLWDYLKLLLVACTRHRDDLAILAWPVLGYWDFVIVRIVLGREAWVVIHDPMPLARAADSRVPGYGRWPRRLAGSRFAQPTAIVHSDEAATSIRESIRLKSMALLPLPMLQPTPKSGRRTDGVTIRVLGQYKANRDLSVLERLAETRRAGWHYEILGRGWEAVPGWKTVDRYVPEAELNELIRASDAVVIPYRWFFQSDIAVRSLEWCTPIVGPKQSSLASLVGQGTGWLTDDNWELAVATAVETEREEVLEVAKYAYDRARSEWTSWLREGGR